MASQPPSFTPKEAFHLPNLTSLIQPPSSSSQTTTYPSDDLILSLLQARSRSDLPYTYLGSSTLIQINPLRNLGNLNEESAREYWEDAKGKGKEGGKGKQPHLYDLAGRVWSLMRSRGTDQAVVFSGITNSGKSYASKILTSQLLRLSSANSPAPHSPFKLSRLALQVQALSTVLESFGCSKTAFASSASQFGRYHELHFAHGSGKLVGGKVLTFGLNKSKLVKLEREERTFHVFYQLLAGAAPSERDALALLDPHEYALLASSGCYRLPGGPFSDDSTQFDELRAAMASLGFKAKHLQSIFSLLITILLLSNLQFDERGANGLNDESCKVAYESQHLVEDVSRRLGVRVEDLEEALTNEMKWVGGAGNGRKELCSVFLGRKGAERQRDILMKDLYAILFAFVVETGNRKIAPPEVEAGEEGEEQTRGPIIVQLELPGYQNRTEVGSSNVDPRGSLQQPLVSTNGSNGLEEFAINFQNELLQSYLTRVAFEDISDSQWFSALREDGISLPQVVTADNSACVEMLRGGILSTGSVRLNGRPGGVFGVLENACRQSERDEQAEETSRQDQEVLADMMRTSAVHSSFIPSSAYSGRTTPTSSSGRTTFGINHYAGPVTYDVRGFIDKNADVLDAQIVGLLRASTESFIAKLVSGPSIAAECHPQDQDTVVQAQVSVSPLREATLRSRTGKDARATLDPAVAHPVTTQLNATLSDLLTSMDAAQLWNVICIRPNDSGHPNSFDKRRVKSQIRSSLLPDLVARKRNEWVASVDLREMCQLFSLRGEGRDVAAMVKNFALDSDWVEGEDFVIGSRSIWFSYGGWKSADQRIRAARGDVDASDDESVQPSTPAVHSPPRRRSVPLATQYGNNNPDYALSPGAPKAGYGESVEDLLIRRTDSKGDGYASPGQGRGYTGYPQGNDSTIWDADYDQKMENPATPHNAHAYPPEKSAQDDHDYTQDGMTAKELAAAEFVVKTKNHTTVEVVPTTKARRWWVRITWLFTWWIPSFLLKWIGRLKRPDVRMAWREKFTIFSMIILLCGTIVFYIVLFGRLLCPNSDKAWNTSELAQHAGTDDYYASIAGKVYDFTGFYKVQHSDIAAYPTTSAIMLELAGQDLTNYFPVPFTVACPGLVTSNTLMMQRANFTPTVAYAIHTSGPLQSTNTSKLADVNWYNDRFSPYVEQYYKGQFVFKPSDVQAQADDGTKIWAIYNGGVYDFTDYFYTITYFATSSGEGIPNYEFLNSDISDIIKQNPGTDVTKKINAVLDGLNSTSSAQQTTCMKNAFYLGDTDFRLTPRCTVQNYLLLAFSVLLMSTIFAKFLAALQLGSKRQPELLDKFVICQVPCYTEGEESLRRTIDSLAALNYDDKRKLMFVICDGNIIGSGNDRPTPRIVLDILGVDPKLDPEPLLFKSIGDGSKQLNYAKVYSGLYEFEGHVVPYMVIVKVGKPSERNKPGNRGKRDSQVLLLHYLNRVHFDGPMNPLELEIYHQMRNIIGIDPAFYEYIFQVDADTTVEADSLNRMISCASDDSSIIGICGETKLANERQSFTTMIQVYEYYISHHLTKAFESLFGSVTCLPGCFSVYRIRTADKGRPIIISSRVIDDYSENNVDTLHKKNLFSLGEDRYLTTLMMKHFPTFKMKFTPDAIAYTVAPDRWAVLLSQRRRWINSTVHNLVELLFLPEMCGFCLFSMRFIVFIDLLGTIILPATCVYLIYLIVVVSTGKAAIPIISLAMIGAVYGLQALIFILKREFMLVGWMIIYILAFPIYSFFLPLYSFWNMDEFSWGSTRVTVGEGSNKKVITDADEHFEDSMIPLKRFSEYEAETWETASNAQSEKSAPLSDYRSSVTGSGVGGRKDLSRRPPPRASNDSLRVPLGGDFYRDSSPLGRPTSNANLRPMASNSTLQTTADTHLDNRQTMAGFSQWGAGSVYGAPPMMNPFMGTPMGSEYGGMQNMAGPNAMTMNNPFNAMGAPRNSVMTNLNDFSGGGGAPSRPTGLARPISTFSLATTHNPFSNPAAIPINYSSDPSDDEIVNTLSQYLSTQDLMSVTKRSVREALTSKFPNADLTSKTAFINSSIDRLLSG